MNVPQLRNVNFAVPIGLLSIAGAVDAVWAASDELVGLSSTALVHLSLFLVAIALGEMAKLSILTGRETAPMSTAAALGLTFSMLSGSGESDVGAAVVIATIAVGMLIGSVASRLARGEARAGDVAARLIGVSVAPLVYRHFTFDGQTLLEWQHEWEDQRWLAAVVMLLVGVLAMLVALTLDALVGASRDQAPLLRSIADEVRSSAALSTALVTSGALIALADYAIGVAALPLFLLPLVLTYFSVQRYATIRVTYRQTIGALSSLTDRAGYTTADHAGRVASLAVAVGRDLGMGQRDLTELEYGALLHDLGQVALREPIPQGATVMAAPADQQRIAHDGADIVRTTGVLDNVARIMEAQTVPYRQVREFGEDLPMASRIIKVANAYDDMAGALGENDERAMERIHLGLGYEYDPRVVESLSRVLRRRRRALLSTS